MELSPDILAKIEQLKIERKAYLPVGSNAGYYRITAQIQYLRHPDKIKTGLYAWRKKNAERIKYLRQTGQAYLPQKPKPLTLEQTAARRASQKKCDAANPQRQIRRNIERILLLTYASISAGNLQVKSPKSEFLISYSIQEFHDHILALLVPHGWSWSDWKSKWTMDHIIPVRSFDLPSQKLACWHYTNLRPLPKHQNHKSYLG